MKKLTKLVLLGLLAVGSLNAKEVFDLQNQYFENAYKQSTKTSSYKLKDTQVFMQNIYQTKDGEYETNSRQSGTLKVKLNENLSTYSLSFKIKVKSLYVRNDSSGITITSSEGNKYIMTFNIKQIQINDKKFDIGKYHNKVLNINIKKEKENISFLVNGQAFMKVADSTFDLSTIGITFNSIYSNGNYSDLLYDLTIIGQ